MDTITLKCKGNTNEILNKPDVSLVDYLWSNDIEVTNIKHAYDEQSKITEIFVYGYEMAQGIIKSIFDNRRKENLKKFLVKNNVELVSYKIGECNGNEWE